MDDWHKVISESLDQYPTITKHLHEAEKAEAMTALPSVELLPPGTRPTEAGWYVVKERWGGADMLNVLPYDCEDGVIGYYSGNPEPQPLILFTFIARIYPDRIGQE